MNPTRAQYFFARAWPLQVVCVLWFIGGPLFFACATASLLALVYAPLSDLWNLLRLGFYTVVALLLALCLAMVVATAVVGILWPLFKPLYQARCRKNGAPFHVGDRVRILAGRHRDRVATVYSPWRDDCVRVELGEREKEKFKDIFSYLELAREDAEPGAAPKGGP